MLNRCLVRACTKADASDEGGGLDTLHNTRVNRVHTLLTSLYLLF
jgi:hypothetical protein